MSKFKHLEQRKVPSQATAEFEFFDDIGMPGAKLIVRPTTSANKAYQNDFLKRTGRNARKIQGGGLSVEMLQSYRAIQKDLFVKHVVQGWRNITDVNKKEVPFSKEDCKDFLDALPDSQFDQLLAFTDTDSNFFETPDEDLAKN